MIVFKKSATPLSQAEMTDWLRELRANAHTPDSGFAVAAVFRAKIGNDATYYFAGVNTENPEHRATTHAEEGAIAAMTTALGKKAEIVEGWVMGAPQHLKTAGSADPMADIQVTCCGKCRQQVVGFAEPTAPIHSITLNGKQSDTTIGALLPEMFSFRQFAPEIAEVQKKRDSIHAPSVDEAASRLIRQGKQLSTQEIFAWLQSLEPVDYATQNTSAIVLKLDNGAYVAGTSVEDAAWVSINPAQSAAAIVRGEFGPQKVVEAWSFSANRDKGKFPADAARPLNFSELQTLNEFAAHDKIPVHVFNGKGEAKTIALKQCPNYAPTRSRPFPDIGAERHVG